MLILLDFFPSASYRWATATDISCIRVRKIVAFGQNKHKRRLIRSWPCSNPAYRYGSNSPIPTGSPEIWALTTFVLPVHNLGFSDALYRGHAPWKILCWQLAQLYETDENLLLSSTLTSGRYLDFSLIGLTEKLWSREEKGFALRPGGKGGTPFPPEEHTVVQTTLILEPGFRQPYFSACGCPEAGAPDHMQPQTGPSHRTPG